MNNAIEDKQQHSINQIEVNLDRNKMGLRAFEERQKLFDYYIKTHGRSTQRKRPKTQSKNDEGLSVNIMGDLSPSLEHVSEMLGNTRQNLNKIEQGLSLPSVEVLARMAKLYQCDIEYLLGLSDERIKGDVEISERLKLSDKAIYKLEHFAKRYYYPINLFRDKMLYDSKHPNSSLHKEIQQEESEHNSAYQLFDYLISNDELYDLIMLLYRFKNQYNIEQNRNSTKENKSNNSQKNELIRYSKSLRTERYMLSLAIERLIDRVIKAPAENN